MDKLNAYMDANSVPVIEGGVHQHPITYLSQICPALERAKRNLQPQCTLANQHTKSAVNARADDMLEEIISDDDDAPEVKDQQVKGKGKKRSRG